VSCPSRKNAHESGDENNERIYMLEHLYDKDYENPKNALRKLHRVKDWASSDEAMS
jgi:hypothetical protein